MNKPSLLTLLLAACCTTASMAQQPKKVKVKHKRGAQTEAPTTPPQQSAPQTVLPASSDLAATYAQTITQEDLRKHLSIIASDAYEGRETGEKGQKMAAEYITNRFKELGLTGPVQGSDNPYLQHFTMERSTWADGATLKVAGQTYQWLQDFYGMGASPFQQETTVQPVFVGYGIEQDGYSDYTGLDVKGKDLLMLIGEPTNAQNQPLLGKDGNPSKWGTDYRAKAALAIQKGARSVFFVDFNPNSNFQKLAARMAGRINSPSIAFKNAQKPTRATMFFVSPAVGYKMLGTTAAAVTKYQQSVTKAGKPVVAPFKSTKFSIKAPRKSEDFTTENVLGYLEGTDKKDELLVLSAHYDHIGITNGEVNNGADDDGSGTVSVLEMAEAFTKAKAEGHGPRRSILFLTVTGEEKGLLGSEYYTDHPVFPLESTVADLNTDMVGRTDKEHEGQPTYVYVIGSDKLSSELHTILQEENQKHDDYHGAGDEVEKIEFQKMEPRARLVFYTAWDLANRDKRIVVDSNKP